MTVALNDPRKLYNGNGVTTTFAAPAFTSSAHLYVWLVSAAGVETPKVEGVAYSVVGSNIVMGVAPASGEKLLILRILPLTQSTDYPALVNGNVLENDMDSVTQKLQQLQEQVDRAILAKRSSSASGVQIPSPQSNAFVGWNSGGTQLENKVPSDLVDAGGGSKKTANLSDLQSIPAARANLGLGTAALTSATDYQPANANIQIHIGNSAGNPHGTVASQVPFTPNVNVASTTVQTAIQEVGFDIDSHIAQPNNAHAASAIAFTPTGNTSANNVQAAIVEIQGDINTLTAGAVTGIAGRVAFFNSGTGLLDSSAKTDAELVTLTATQTLTNKTLTAPVISSPTGLVKADVGLGNVDNTSDATKNSAVATLTNKTLTTPVINSPTGIVKADVGLGNVDNTADTAKPVSTLQQAALDLKANLASPTFTGTVAGITKTMVGLGNVDNTADTAKPVSTAQQTALDLKANLASPTFTGTVSGITKAMVGLGNVDNTSDAAYNAAAATLLLKTIGDALTFTAVATPSTPTAGLRKFYPKSDGKFYHLGPDGIETAVGSGSGGGGGGINLLTLDASFLVTKPSNADAETVVFDWVAYADAAATQPVDMTAGTVTGTTIARSTTSPLNGAGHFLMTLTTGASRQGEGVSCTANVPPAYRGKTLAFTFPFAATGTLVEDDFKLYVFDVTNSELITPFTFGKILGASGQAGCTFPVKTNTTQIRVGVHVARVSTAVATISFDDVKVSPEIPAYGMAGSNSTFVALTATGLGTITNVGITAQRVGDVTRFRGSLSVGTVTASTVSFGLPAGVVVDTSKLSALNKTVKVGDANIIFSTGAWASSAYGPFPLYVDTGTPTVIYISIQGASALFATTLGTALCPSNSNITLDFTIPVAGQDANVTMANANQFRISSYLANGTRVTGTAPAKYGEWRSQGRSASAHTYSDMAPATLPTANDGILLYNGKAWGTADAANNPTKYEKFVGKGRKQSEVTWEFFKSAGRVGKSDCGYRVLTGASFAGYLFGYEQDTGLAWIKPNYFSGVETNHYCGFDDAANSLLTAYADVVVSEGARAVGVQAPRSSVEVHTFAGRGSTNTAIHRYTTTKTNAGTAITYSDSATLGASFTINEDGVYSVLMTSGTNNGNGRGWAGISKNSANLTVGISTLSNTERLAVQGFNGTTGGGTIYAASWSGILNAGTIIRPHGTTEDPTLSADSIFVITKVSN